MSTQPLSSGFPFQDKVASAVFKTIPKGLVTSRATLKEFLDPPTVTTTRFYELEWDAASKTMEQDSRISFDEYQAMRAQMDIVRAGLGDWVNKRDPATAKQGYGATPDAMRKSGSKAFYATVKIQELVNDYSFKSNRNTGDRLKNFVAALWEYAACMGVELEASTRQTPARDVLDSVNQSVAAPWKPVDNPANFNANKVLGAARIPDMVDPPVKADDPPDQDPEWSETGVEDEKGGEGGEGT